MKKYISQLLSSISFGITIGLIIATSFSSLYKLPYLYPSSSSFVSHFSSPLNSLITSILIWGAMGILFFIANFIFSVETWSITKQTIYHFFTTYIGYTSLALIAGWFPINLIWISFYTLIYLTIYFIIWLISMHYAKSLVKKINKSIT